MILGIIQSRLESKRLPGKALMNIDGKPILKHVIDRASEIKSLDALTVATYYGGNNGAIAGRCDDWDVPCYQYDGPADDVLGRFVACAKATSRTNPKTGEREGVDYVVRICGDAPLFDSQSADHLVGTAFERKADYTAYKLPGTDDKPTAVQPIGYFGEVVTVEALERADRELPKGAPEREHVVSCMYAADQSKFTRPFTAHLEPVPKWYHKEKLKHSAIDTMEDYERVREVLEKE